MSNKFLGLDSINVLVDYIDREIAIRDNASKLVTIVAYKYVADADGVPGIPTDGGFDFNGGNIVYPSGWNSLRTVITNIIGSNANQDAAIEAALAIGSIYMTVGVELANEINWSYPVKISGQNGVSARFAYSYDLNAAEADRTNVPSGVNVDNRIEYVWTKYGESDWSGPTIWAMYTQDAAEVLYRYCVTATSDKPNAPISDTDPNWTNSASASVTDEKPFMWMTSKRVPAGTNSSDALWSEPILFGHYGMDGLDGNIPKYSITLYAMTNSIGEVPEFVCEEGDNISEVIEANTNWSDLPTREDETETSVWWYVVVNVNGGDKENPDLINTVNNFSTVKRFSALDGEQLTSVYTQYLYYWSSTQVLPNNLTDEDWLDAPVYNSADHDGSLWMKMGVCKLNTRTGEIEMVNTEKPWSDPVKISGPRGPIAYDYRTESVFGAGDKTNAPTNWKTMTEVTLTDDKPYIWEKRYLSLYKMKYADKANADGTYDVVEDAFVKTIGTPDVFRLSGINGATGADGKNGNRLNTIAYTTVDENRTISNFDEINYFISNSSSDTHYVLNGNKFGDFVSGYTGKFANIGTGNMIITVVDANIVGSATSTTEITVAPQESIDLISYNNNNVCEFILIGKPLTTNSE